MKKNRHRRRSEWAGQWDRHRWEGPHSRRRRRRRSGLVEMAAWTGLVVFGGGMLLTRGLPVPFRSEAPAPLRSDAFPGTGDQFACTVASITDGDTLRCRESEETGGAIRVRVSGIAAREADNTCSPGHPCPAASADVATAQLRLLASGEVLSCLQVGSSYGRRAAFCRTGSGLDLSCAMIESGTVARWDRHWGNHRC
jgi:endonuclease YncB( thermonuclease family)